MSTDTSFSISAEDEAAVQAVPGRVIAAWADNDADAFAAVFTEDGSMILPGDVYLTGRDAIRSYMTQAYAGPYQGSRVFGRPLAVKHLDDGLALVITQGGVLAPGEVDVPSERAVRASWLLARQDSEWLITAYQNTPVPAS
jgi:uncharacterized protein (TIGR02246 family)